jgi:hypothetical protein
MVRRSVLLGPSLPMQFYQPIGHLVAVWARLEEEIDNLLEDLHGCPAVAALGDIPAPFRRRAERLVEAANLCFQATPDLVARFTSIGQRAIQFGRHRNLIVHGRIWFGTPLLAFNNKREIVLTVNTVMQITNEIAALTEEVSKLNRPPAFEQIRPGSDGLTSPERAVLQNFRKTNPSLPGHPHRPMPPSVARQQHASPPKTR